jgi:undecaprenol kinase
MRAFMKSLGFALTGIRMTLRTERNFRIHLIAMIVALAVGIYLRLSVSEWCLVVISIGLVLAAELFNTAVERLSSDVAAGERKPLIKQAKDISAAAVLVTTLTALAIGIIILVIPLIHKLTDFITS